MKERKLKIDNINEINYQQGNLLPLNTSIETILGKFVKLTPEKCLPVFQCKKVVGNEVIFITYVPQRQKAWNINLEDV